MLRAEAAGNAAAVRFRLWRQLGPAARDRRRLCWLPSVGAILGLLWAIAASTAAFGPLIAG
jgi:hypothetical protein